MNFSFNSKNKENRNKETCKRFLDLIKEVIK